MPAVRAAAAGPLLPAARGRPHGPAAPSDTRTSCAYKGQASYLSTATADDVAWTYPEPLREAAEVTGRIAFFNERADVVVDGERLRAPGHALVAALVREPDQRLEPVAHRVVRPEDVRDLRRLVVEPGPIRPAIAVCATWIPCSASSSWSIRA